MAADLDTLISTEIPEGKQNLLDSYTNLEKVAEYCENNYFQCENKRAALEETKGYTTQSLASVAYQINTLAYNFLQMLDLQSAQLSEMESQVNHIVQTVGIHKEKVARREIGILTTNKSLNRQYKIIAPANQERPVKYVRKPIDYSILDDIGHGVRVAQPPHLQHYQQQQQARRPSSSGGGSGGGYAPGMLGASQYAPGSVSGPAPTTKPPTPPQAVRYGSGGGSGGGTLNRGSKEYRTPPVVNPPQVPSNYAPNYPRQQQQERQQQKQYGTLPQVQMVHPVQQGPDPMDHLRSAGTMPRLSSSSMRSTASSQGSGSMGGGGGGGDPMAGMYGKLSNTLGRPPQQQQLIRQNTPPGSLGGSSSRHSNTPPTQQQPQYMTRPAARPPSPPLPPPPMTNDPQQIYMQQMQQLQQQQQHQQQQLYARQGSLDAHQHQLQQQQYYQRQNSADAGNPIYSRQVSATSVASSAAESNYARQQQQLQAILSRQNSQQAVQQQQKPLGPASGDNNLPGWVPKNYLERVAAIYDYTADKDDELSFNEGATIYVLKKNDDGWWEGVMNGVTGLFPGNYVEASL